MSDNGTTGTISLQEALQVYFAAQEAAWECYQRDIWAAKARLDVVCVPALKQEEELRVQAWEEFSSSTEQDWEQYLAGLRFYRDKLRFPEHYDRERYDVDTTGVWMRYKSDTAASYSVYLERVEKAQLQFEGVLGPAESGYRRELQGAWEEYKRIENPAWADLEQARKELRAASDVSQGSQES